MVFLSHNTPEKLIAQFAGLRAVVEIPDAVFACAQSGILIGCQPYRAFGSATAANESPVRWEIDYE